VPVTLRINGTEHCSIASATRSRRPAERPDLLGPSP
jgi:hypothetical protein